MKIAVIGHSGSGKSTLADKLSQIYKIPVLFLDTVQFKPGWAERDAEEGRAIVWQFMQNENWVIDGNYDKFFKKERLNAADAIIFLDFGRITCLYRALSRYFKYKNTVRKSMAEGCLEKMDAEFALWILYKGRNKEIRNGYKKILAEHKDKTIVLKNQREMERYIAKVLNEIK